MAGRGWCEPGMGGLGDRLPGFLGPLPRAGAGAREAAWPARSGGRDGAYPPSFFSQTTGAHSHSRSSTPTAPLPGPLGPNCPPAGPACVFCTHTPPPPASPQQDLFIVNTSAFRQADLGSVCGWRLLILLLEWLGVFPSSFACPQPCPVLTHS